MVRKGVNGEKRAFDRQGRTFFREALEEVLKEIRIQGIGEVDRAAREGAQVLLVFRHFLDGEELILGIPGFSHFLVSLKEPGELLFVIGLDHGSDPATESPPILKVGERIRMLGTEDSIVRFPFAFRILDIEDAVSKEIGDDEFGPVPAVVEAAREDFDVPIFVAIAATKVIVVDDGGPIQEGRVQAAGSHEP